MSSEEAREHELVSQLTFLGGLPKFSESIGNALDVLEGLNFAQPRESPIVGDLRNGLSKE